MPMPWTSRVRLNLARMLAKSSSFAIIPPWITTTVLRPTFHSLIREAYQRNSVVMACISSLAFSFPEPPLLIYSSEADDAPPLPNHPLRQLLRQPNPTMGEAELMAITIAYLAIGGNAYWQKVRDKTGRVVQLWPYHAGHIVPEPGGPTWIQRYRYDVLGTGSVTADTVTIESSDIVHFRWPIPDPRQPWIAQAPLMAAASEVDADNEASRYLLGLLQNDAVPRTVLTVPTDRFLQPDELERMKEQWRERYGGANIGDVAILEGGTTVSRLGLNLEEMAFEALHAIPEVRIAAAFRVPPIIAGLLTGLQRSTFANYGEARQAFTQDTLAPLWRLASSEVQSSLLSEFITPGRTQPVARFDVTRVASLQEDRAKRWQYVSVAWSSGLLRKNEARRALGYMDDAEGDVWAVQPQTATAEMEALPTQGVMGNGGAEASTVALTASAAPVAPKATRTTSRAMVQRASITTVERRMAKALTLYLAEEYETAAHGVRDSAKSALPSSLLDSLGLDTGDVLQLLMLRFYPLLMDRAFDDAALALDVALAFDVANPLIQTILDELASQVVRVTDTTCAEIQALVGRHAAEGWSIEQLASEITGLSEIHSETRARSIAATESAAAYSRGSIAAYQESGIVTNVEWLTADGACEVCQGLNGVIVAVALGGTFLSGVAHPPAHPGCRCAVAPILD